MVRRTAGEDCGKQDGDYLTDSFPEPRETNKNCSLDLSPHPDSGLFGNRKESEQESVSAKFEADELESEEDSDANKESSDASSRDPVEPGKGNTGHQ